MTYTSVAAARRWQEGRALLADRKRVPDDTVGPFRCVAGRLGCEENPEAAQARHSLEAAERGGDGQRFPHSGPGDAAWSRQKGPGPGDPARARSHSPLARWASWEDSERQSYSTTGRPPCGQACATTTPRS